jgi:hypothetical protein
MLSGGPWPDHRVVGAVRLPASGRCPRRVGRGRASGGLLQPGDRLPVGVVPASVASARRGRLGVRCPGLVSGMHQTRFRE